ncbi:hypothetical protein [Nocardioides sp.]|uniref:hypothetical protein n=1 Tax=Nocardioides sp. TaxID=35761 RepID=UPI0027369247|nr:hypothetical protein [Nocardioides sp.]MDP3894358.1 hypothetical protein [Nocardioides sp.]
MKPLQPIAIGMVIIALRGDAGGYDVFADPIGWLFVLLGLHHAPLADRRRGTLRTLAVFAAAIATALWFPRVADGIHDTDPALTWAVNLPQVAFTVVLCLALAEQAAEADPPAARWLRTTMTLLVVVGVLPVLVFGAGMASLEVPTYVGAGAVLVLLISLLLTYAGRPWARVDSDGAGSPAAG